MSNNAAIFCKRQHTLQIDKSVALSNTFAKVLSAFALTLVDKISTPKQQQATERHSSTAGSPPSLMSHRPPLPMHNHLIPNGNRPHSFHRHHSVSDCSGKVRAFEVCLACCAQGAWCAAYRPHYTTSALFFELREVRTETTPICYQRHTPD